MNRRNSAACTGRAHSTDWRSALLLLPLLVAVSFGQTIEQPVPFDRAGRVLTIDRDARDRLKLFADESQFTAARLWRSEAGYTLEINYPDGTRKRSPLTSEQAAGLVQRTSIGLPLLFPGTQLNQEGRGLFLLNQIPLALAWYSPALLFLTQPSKFEVGASIYALGAATFYFGPLLLTRHVPMTNAQAATSFDYAIYGIANSFCLTSLLGMEDFFNFEDTVSSSLRAGIMLGTSIGGQVLGYYLGRNRTLGQARYASLITDCGIGDGALLGTFLQGLANPNSTENFSKINSALAITGTAAGAYIGHHLARRQDWTEGQVTGIGIGSFLGPVFVNLLYATVAGDDDNTTAIVPGLALVGNIGGTFLAQQVFRSTRLTNSAGYIALGTTLGGGMVGAGIGFLVAGSSSNFRDASRWTTALGAAGLAGGFVLGVKLAQDVTASSRPQGTRNIEVNLAGIGAGLVDYAARREFSAPVLVSVRFP